MRYRLVDHGYPFKKIMCGRQWVGRVFRHADGTWRGMIGRAELSLGATPTDAFSEAVARHLGYASSAALKRRNAAVLYARRQRAVRGDALAREFMQAKTMDERFAALDKLTTPEQFIEAIEGVTRSLK